MIITIREIFFSRRDMSEAEFRREAARFDRAAKSAKPLDLTALDAALHPGGYRQAPPMKNPEYLAVHIANTTAKGGR